MYRGSARFLISLALVALLGCGREVDLEAALVEVEDCTGYWRELRDLCDLWDEIAHCDSWCVGHCVEENRVCRADCIEECL